MLNMIGEQFEDADEVNGAVVSVRVRGDRLALWTKHSKAKEAQERIGTFLKLSLGIPPAEPLGYIGHSEAAANRAAKYVSTFEC
jgi:translation initiation factor 4E